MLIIVLSSPNVNLFYFLLHGPKPMVINVYLCDVCLQINANFIHLIEEWMVYLKVFYKIRVVFIH